MAEDFQNLNEILAHSVQRFAERPLFGVRTTAGWTWTSYGEFAVLVARCRAGLTRLGVGRGDRVGIVAENCIPWAVTCYAAAGVGAALVPMYAAQTVAEWEYIVRDSGARCVLAGTESIRAALAQRSSQLPALEHVVALGDSPDAGLSWADLVSETQGQRQADAVRPNDVAAIIYTSGTMGTPKGVLLSQRNLASNASAARSIFPISERDRSLSFLPWAHAYGQTSELHTLLSRGCSIALNDELPYLVRNLPEVEPTILVAVPRIFNRIYEGVQKQIRAKPAPVRLLFEAGVRAHAQREAGERLSVGQRVSLRLADRLIFSAVRQKFGGRLRFAVSGSAALNPAVAQFMGALGIGVHEGYGLTEASPTVAANTPAVHRAGTVGRALPGVTVSVDTNVAGAEGGEGELIVHGPGVMLGYYGKPDETAEALRPDGGLRTGDLGHVDADGFIHVTGRIKEQYKLENGKYVAPGPLEEQLKMVPLVSQAMLHGANHRYNVVLLVVDPTQVREWAAANGVVLAGSPNEVPELREYLWNHVKSIAASFRSYERPQGVLIVDDDVTVESGLLTPTLKLKRHRMLAKYGDQLQALYGT